jgi:hypothetical protein
MSRHGRTGRHGLLDEVPVRPLLEHALEVRFPLPPGDRPLVEPGTRVEAGDALLEHLRDRHIEEVHVQVPAGEERPFAGDRRAVPHGRRHEDHDGDGELLAPVPGKRDRWRVVAGSRRDPVESPLAGEVVLVRPGAEIRVRASGPALRGAFAAGAPARGRLELATDPSGELRAGGIDVARAGSILVVGSRIDAEALTRARAMGVRGIVVASLPGKELRDFQASEHRQRASLQPLAPFAVLVLDGTIRRPIPGPVAAVLERLAGSEVALLIDPPSLVFDADPGDLPAAPADWVRIRSGANAGREGRVVELLGQRRFAAGVILDAARVAIDGEPAVDVALGDLERFG